MELGGSKNLIFDVSPWSMDVVLFILDAVEANHLKSDKSQAQWLWPASLTANAPLRDLTAVAYQVWALST